MAQTLEKVFLQKVSQMPKEECDVTAVTTKEQVKERKTNAGILCKNNTSATHKCCDVTTKEPAVIFSGS